MYTIILEQAGYNTVKLTGLNRDEATGLMFDVVGHIAGGKITLMEERENEDQQEEE